jgi:hypothetical protein
MATATRSEYIAIDDLPLTTAAWETEDIASIMDGPGTRGNDLSIPTRAGSIARRRTLEPRQISIPLVVNGWYDSDGGAHATAREGLLANLDELKQHLSPKYTTVAGTRTLEWISDEGTYRTAEVHVSPALDVSMVGPNAARVVITATIPGGVLRGGGQTWAAATLATSTITNSFPITVSGSGEVQDAEIYIDGPATWPGPYTPLTGSGAPTPGSGSTGDYYLDEDNGDLYGPRESGGDWPGPIEYSISGSAPTDTRIFGPTHHYDVVAEEVYGPRTTANPDADDITIANLTYDSAGGVYVQYPDPIEYSLVIEAGTYSATYDTTDVSGAIINAGNPIWLPLVPGTNDLQIDLGANSADLVVVVVHRAVWL